MRRNDRQITDRATIDDVIRRCRVCRLGFCDHGQPYVVPMNFGYDGVFLYFHSAPEGRKVGLLQGNARVCFELDIPGDVLEGDQACAWGARYESVIGFGACEVLEDVEAKRVALGWIMKQFSNRTDWSFPEQNLNKVMVFRLRIDEVSGKASL
jgi:uncharacterized protein